MGGIELSSKQAADSSGWERQASPIPEWILYISSHNLSPTSFLTIVITVSVVQIL